MNKAAGENKAGRGASSKEWNKQLAETLDEMGFAHKPGSTKGRMYSSRFYHAELIKVITALKDAEVESEIRQFEINVVCMIGMPGELTQTQAYQYLDTRLKRNKAKGDT